MQTATLARVHGWANVVVGGLWPLLSMRTFEAVTGPKVDRWLVRTVAGLLLANGVAQLRHPEAARTIGIGTAATLAAIDLTYAPRGRISKMYLLDAAIEAGIIAAWVRTAATPAPAP